MLQELPGRTMDFTFDLSQTPVIGRKYLPKAGSQPATGPSSLSNASTTTPDKGELHIQPPPKPPTAAIINTIEISRITEC